MGSHPTPLFKRFSFCPGFEMPTWPWSTWRNAIWPVPYYCFFLWLIRGIVVLAFGFYVFTIWKNSFLERLFSLQMGEEGEGREPADAAEGWAWDGWNPEAETDGLSRAGMRSCSGPGGRTPCHSGQTQEEGWLRVRPSRSHPRQGDALWALFQKLTLRLRSSVTWRASFQHAPSNPACVDLLNSHFLVPDSPY